ncbi:hypothetical protein [Micromonospora sp. HM5-17]|uniref:hypothetical protein n=1 Tax=Micromonospora sp. HM5-17 TaxID=2487710 RepID=UPI001F1B59A2|nr:hypothetical protein [Micromonospora sp. HM5-17]
MSPQPAYPTPHPGTPPPGFPPPRAAGAWRRPGSTYGPSGLFPSGPPPRPARPTYREPHPVRLGAVAAGAGGALLWLLTFGLLAHDLRGYLWWTLLAGTVAWLVALVLTWRGDRGVAVGVATVVAVGWTVAAILLALRWRSSGDWPLW